MMTWISRFSFTFIIFGALLFYWAFQWQTGKLPMETWQAVACVVGGAVCVALGAQGIKHRHRRYNG